MQKFIDVVTSSFVVLSNWTGNGYQIKQGSSPFWMKVNLYVALYFGLIEFKFDFELPTIISCGVKFMPPLHPYFFASIVLLCHHTDKWRSLLFYFFLVISEGKELGVLKNYALWIQHSFGVTSAQLRVEKIKEGIVCFNHDPIRLSLSLTSLFVPVYMGCSPGTFKKTLFA